MRRPALLALLLLGGCGMFGSLTPPIPEGENTPDHAACRAEAQRSPAVLALAQQANPAAYGETRQDQERRVAVQRAYRDCLRARGMARPGGVEPERNTR
jgi:hypothetical protein